MARKLTRRNKNRTRRRKQKGGINVNVPAPQLLERIDGRMNEFFSDIGNKARQFIQRDTYGGKKSRRRTRRNRRNRNKK
tara:strand:+ start:7442 stop:7678 length:237 start_codon:yes stop_codon:yes gene_type:complete